MSEKLVTITTRIDPFECGMCGPSGKFVGIVRVSDELCNHRELFTQALCDNSDPMDVRQMLVWALEYIGYKVEINERD